jgi:hypothetical protein
MKLVNWTGNKRSCFNQVVTRQLKISVEALFRPGNVASFKRQVPRMTLKAGLGLAKPKLLPALHRHRREPAACIGNALSHLVRMSPTAASLESPRPMSFDDRFEFWMERCESFLAWQRKNFLDRDASQRNSRNTANG